MNHSGFDPELRGGSAFLGGEFLNEFGSLSKGAVGKGGRKRRHREKKEERKEERKEETAILVKFGYRTSKRCVIIVS